MQTTKTIHIFLCLVGLCVATETPLNLAIGRPTYQSSTDNDTSTVGNPLKAEYAADGNVASRAEVCARTQNESGAWWVVDIGGKHRVQKVIITTGDNSSDSVERLLDFYIRVGNSFNPGSFDPTTFTECWYQSSALPHGETREFSCSQTILGSFVAISLPASRSQQLQLCEVQVFSDIVLLAQNIAKNKAATQSSQWGSRAASFAVDGDFSCLTTPCTHTQQENGAWWQVDLTEPDEIDKVAITTRDNNGVRLRNFYIDVSNSSDGSSAQNCVYETTPFLDGETRILTCARGVVGQFLRIRITHYDFMHICEVQIMPQVLVEKTKAERFLQNTPTTKVGFLPCLATCLLDETCSAVNREGNTCQLHPLPKNSNTTGVDFYLEKIDLN